MNDLERCFVWARVRRSDRCCRSASTAAVAVATTAREISTTRARRTGDICSRPTQGRADLLNVNLDDGALVSLVAAGLVPPEHVETAVAISVMLASFAPAAMRRDVLAKRKALPDMPESMTETTEAPDESA